MTNVETNPYEFIIDKNINISSEMTDTLYIDFTIESGATSNDNGSYKGYDTWLGELISNSFPPNTKFVFFILGDERPGGGSTFIDWAISSDIDLTGKTTVININDSYEVKGILTYQSELERYFSIIFNDELHDNLSSIFEANNTVDFKVKFE